VPLIQEPFIAKYPIADNSGYFELGKHLIDVSGQYTGFTLIETYASGAGDTLVNVFVTQ
jgi:hypothetical protein